MDETEKEIRDFFEGFKEGIEFANMKLKEGNFEVEVTIPSEEWFEEQIAEALSEDKEK